MKESLKIAIDFAEKIKETKGVVQIILFGSVARGEDKANSDIDIAIVHEGRDKFEIMKEINRLKDEKIQATFLDIRELPNETELTGALSGEGILLYGQPIKIKTGKTELKAKILISYSLSKLAQTTKVKVNRALYGSVSKSEFKGKKYITATKGMINEPGIEKINKGTLLVDRSKSVKIVNMLKRFGVDFREIPVWTY